jgi:CubicO group peptidase (beta-lactamase class C family)
VKTSIVFVLVVLVVLGVPRLSATVDLPAIEQPPNLQAIDTYLESKQREYKIPGLALAIVKGDRVIHLKGFGIADPHKRSMTPDTPFILGSVSKSFTAVAIAQLVDAGKVNLDTPVQKYLPWFSVDNPQSTSQITVRHLLSHTSGISTYTGRDDFSNNDVSEKALENQVRGLKTVSLSEPVGKKFQYSNTNYTILGTIVQVVSGMSYDRYIQQHIFTPLEMLHSYTSQTKALQGTPPLSFGNRFWFGYPVATEVPYNQAGLPDGYLIASVSDLAHYLIAHLNDGRYKNIALASSARMTELHQPAVEVGDGVAYGMGWFARKVDDLQIVSHSGTVANYSSNITLIPSENLGFALLTNVYPGVMGEPIGQLYKGIVNLLVSSPPSVVKNNLFAQLQVIALPILLMLQLLGFFRAWIVLRRWGQISKFPPKNTKFLARHIGLPLIADGAISGGLSIGLPILFDAPLSVMLFYQPDLIGMAIVSATLALIGGLLRTFVSIQVLKSRNMLL